MRKFKFCSFLTIASIILLAICSCKKTFSPELRECDQLLSTNYKQGEAMLDSLHKTNKQMSTANKKYEQLLRLKATDKAYRPINKQKHHIDDLVSYFQHAGDNNLLAEAYYYAGRVYYEIGDKPQSLEFYQKAKDNVAKDNYALQGDLYSQMANIYSDTNLNKEAIKTLQLAWKADSLSGSTRNMLFDIKDIGEIYYEENNISKAQQYYQKGLEIANIKNDSMMQTIFHHKLATTSIQMQKWDFALNHTELYMSNINTIHDNSGMLVTALKVYSHFQDYAKIKYYNNRILSEGNIYAKQYVTEQVLFSLANKKQDSILYSLLYTYKNYNDSIRKESNSAAIKKAEQSYNYDLIEIENKNLRFANKAKSIGLIMTVTIILLTVISFYMRMRNIKQQQKILELKLTRYEELKEKANLKTEARVSEELETIKKADIYSLIQKEITTNHFRLQESQWNELSQLINSVYKDFDKNLHNFLETSQREYKICLLIKIGISPTNIAHFVNVSKEAITASRRRMYVKSFKKQGSPSDWDHIITSL